MADPFEPECDSHELINLYPCLRCLSDSQLFMLLFYLWAYLWNLEDDLISLLQNSVDGTSLSNRQMLEAEVAMMAHAMLRQADVPTIIESVKCLPCADPKLIRAAILKLQCQFWRLLE